MFSSAYLICIAQSVSAVPILEREIIDKFISLILVKRIIGKFESLLNICRFLYGDTLEKIFNINVIFFVYLI
jgi:hypothetical protein